MSKAEDRALERFPVHKGASKEWIESHLKGICSDYIEGYNQAEKDLELTWKDIKLIIDIVDSENLKPHLFDEIDYQEVLKRFKEQRYV